jgi:hypothetical protein
MQQHTDYSNPPWNPTGYRARHRNHLLNRSKWNQDKKFPCWCGDSLVESYRHFSPCCAAYLDLHSNMLYMDLNTEYLYTQRRADGQDIGGEFTFLVALNNKDWDSAEVDAEYLDEQKEYWLDTWVLVQRQSRMLGPEPLEDEDEDDDTGGDQDSV